MVMTLLEVVHGLRGKIHRIVVQSMVFLIPVVKRVELVVLIQRKGSVSFTMGVKSNEVVNGRLDWTQL